MKAVFTDADLFALIPQRPPIVMVDLLQNVTESEAETGLLIKEDNIFVQNGQMQEPGLIEHIAQSAAAFAGFRGYASGEEPRLGYIGELKRLFLYARPNAGARLNTHLRVLGEAAGITLLAAETKVGDEVVAAGQMKIFLKED
ncbi:MAG: beta-hydroxyacyl-ACP dehydratase [Paludibacteraceae bacterium]|nr:beta-hydroxyacyl-ACP dehydratase [Paludibacteraceae bacterium]